MTKEYLIPSEFLAEIEKFLRKNKKSISPQGFQKYASSELKQWLEERKIPPKFLFYIYKNHLTKIILPTCPICGKELSFEQIIKEHIYCSQKCANSSKESKEKRKRTWFKKYGVENPSQSKEIREKYKKTILEKYGVENPFQSKEVQEKKKETMMHRYGVEFSSQSNEIKEKAKQTCLEKYGVEFPFHSEEIKNKRKQTNLKRYGVECTLHSKEVAEKVKQTCLIKFGKKYASQSKEFQEKKRKTCLEKYGVGHPSQSEEIKERIQKTCLEKYGVTCSLQSEEAQEKAKQTNLGKYGVEFPQQSVKFQDEVFRVHRSEFWDTFCCRLKEKDIIPLFDKEEYVNDTGRKFKCLCCNEVFESEGTCDYLKRHKKQDDSYTTLLTQNIHCPYCSRLFSKKEKDVLGFIKTVYNGEIQENVKGLFPNKNMELDIFLPQLNLGIEFDGNYWHSLEGARERDEQKTQLCGQRGIRLLRIKESDWDNNRESVEKELKATIISS